MRIPVTTTLHIEEFSGGVASEISSGVTNGIYDQYADGTYYVTQRPSVNIFEDASATVSDVQGRGVYYWSKVDARYIVNYDTVYKSNYSNPLGVNLTAGSERVYFFEVGDYLVILDPENQEGWYIASGASTTLVQITDTDFPTEQTPALTLCKGGAVINGILYVGATDGTIWNCATEDPTSWGTLDFISAEIAQDNLVMIGEHGQHVVAFGVRTTEFFYDAANSSGSPLSVRTDIDYSVGTINQNTMYNDGENLFFVNLNPSGDLNVSVLSNFQLQRISTPSIDRFITSAAIVDSLTMVGSGFSTGGKSYYVLTVYYLSAGAVVPLTSITYNSSNKTWSFFELMHTGIDRFPLVDWTRATETRAGDGILSNGDIVTIQDDNSPSDTTEAQVYVASGYVDPGYISDTGGTGNDIQMIVVTGQNDLGSRQLKYADNLRVIADQTDASQLITVQWSDDKHSNYNTGRTVDLNNPNSKITRCGRFRSRNFKLTATPSERVDIQGLEMDVK